MQPQSNRQPIPDEPFTLRVLWADGLSIVRLTGSVGLEAGGAFESAMLGQIDRLDDTVVLDLSGVSFINVIGLGVIVRIGNRLRARGGRLMLHGGDARIQRLIAVVRLDELFPDPGRLGRADMDQMVNELACCC